MTDPSPTPDQWQDFYKNPPPAPPVVKSPVPKGKVALAIIVPIVVLLVGWQVLSWALTPTTPTTSPADQRPAAVIPPDVTARILSPTPTAPPRTFTVAAPDTLAGRTKNKEPDLVKVASDEETRLKGLPKATSVVSVFYGSNQKKNLVLVLAAAASMSSSDLDTLVNNALVGSEVIKQPSAFEAGPLGGRAACAEAKNKGVQISVCGWVDEGSIGIIALYYTSLEKAQAEFHSLRAAVEKVS